eukprot:98748-Rhodomonas_salina.1
MSACLPVHPVCAGVHVCVHAKQRARELTDLVLDQLRHPLQLLVRAAQPTSAPHVERRDQIKQTRNAVLFAVYAIDSAAEKSTSTMTSRSRAFSRKVSLHAMSSARTSLILTSCSVRCPLYFSTSSLISIWIGRGEQTGRRRSRRRNQRERGKHAQQSTQPGHSQTPFSPLSSLRRRSPP